MLKWDHNQFWNCVVQSHVKFGSYLCRIAHAPNHVLNFMAPCNVELWIIEASRHKFLNLGILNMMSNTMDEFMRVDDTKLPLIKREEFKWTFNGDFDVPIATKDGVHTKTTLDSF